MLDEEPARLGELIRDPRPQLHGRNIKDFGYESNDNKINTELSTDRIEEEEICMFDDRLNALRTSGPEYWHGRRLSTIVQEKKEDSSCSSMSDVEDGFQSSVPDGTYDSGHGPSSLAVPKLNMQNAGLTVKKGDNFTFASQKAYNSAFA